MMAKNYTKAAKLRAKKSLPELARTPKRDRNGCFAERTRQQPDPAPETTVLDARKRQTGAKDPQHPALSEGAGRAIIATREGDEQKKKESIERLWNVYKGLTAAEARYMRLVLGKQVHAKTAKIEMMPERFETRADDKPDLRSEEERHRDAVNTWMRWRGMVEHLPVAMRVAIFNTVYDRVTVYDAGEVTGHGRKFVKAMELLADVVEEKFKK